MNEQEQESIEPLKYQLRQWRELVNKYLPPTDCDRDDVKAIEALIQQTGSNSVSKSLDFDQQKRIDKVQASSFEEGSKLIFMWVKSGHINVRQFIELNAANREAC